MSGSANRESARAAGPPRIAIVRYRHFGKRDQDHLLRFREAAAPEAAAGIARFAALPTVAAKGRARPL